MACGLCDLKTERPMEIPATVAVRQRFCGHALNVLRDITHGLARQCTPRNVHQFVGCVQSRTKPLNW